MPAKPLIFRSFQAERQKAGDGHFGALSIKVTAEDKPQKEHDLGITLGRGETHRICDALGRKIPLRRDFHGDCPDRQRRAPAAAPVSRSKPRPWRANHSQKINRIASNRRELARA